MSTGFLGVGIDSAGESRVHLPSPVRRRAPPVRVRKSLKILIAGLSRRAAYSAGTEFWVHKEDDVMAKKTCAACDYELDANAIEVTVGGKTVEVCCQECAEKLKEAHRSASAPSKA
jgi:hypothetical protein